MKPRHRFSLGFFVSCLLLGSVQSFAQKPRPPQKEEQQRQIRIAVTVGGKDLVLRRDIETFFRRGLLDFNKLEYSDRLLTKEDPDITVHIMFMPTGEGQNTKIAFAYRAMVQDQHGEINPGWGQSGWIVWEGMLVSKTDDLREVEMIADVIIAHQFNVKVVDEFRKVLQRKSKRQE